MRDAGWRVVIATSGSRSREWKEEGLLFEPVDFARGGLALHRDWTSYRRLCQIYRKYRPRLVHHFNAKPVIAGTMAAQRMGGPLPKIVNTITGLGYAFGKIGSARVLSGMGYRLALRHSDATIFQNTADRDLFLRKGWVEAGKTHMVLSSGVDTRRFRPADRTPRPEQHRILLVSRLLRQKGIQEFIEAAEKIKKIISGARFQLAGEWELSHPDAFPRERIERAVENGTIEYLGFISNIESILAEADLLVAPSYYREGVPRVVLEAASCGLPVIGADVPGTRDVIVDGQTGFLVPPRDSLALGCRIEELLSDLHLRRRLGRAGRRWVEEHCNLEVVTEKQLEIYRQLDELIPQ